MGLKKKVFFSLVIFCIFLVVLEGSLRLIKRFIILEKSTIETFSSYAETDWIGKYYEELTDVKSRYESFVGWQMEEFSGEYINILPNGTRKTWNPDFSEKESPKKIFVFGGSTIWGKGARDDHTIPSYLSKALNEKQNKFDVTSRSAFAYILQQEIIDLILLLKRGERPDYVVFYDGINDVYAAYQNGKTGSHQNINEVKEKLKPPTAFNNFGYIYKGLIGIIQNNSELYRTFWKIKNNFAKNEVDGGGVEGLVASNYNEEEILELSKEIIDDYKKGVELVDHLSRAYGFEYMFVWQPVMFTHTNVLPEESDLIRKDRMIEELFMYTYDLMFKEEIKNFYNLSKIFEDKNEAVFLDFAHLTEKGNQTITNEIYNIFKEKYE